MILQLFLNHADVYDSVLSCYGLINRITGSETPSDISSSAPVRSLIGLASQPERGSKSQIPDPGFPNRPHLECCGPD
jgi:hypothetical protein